LDVKTIGVTGAGSMGRRIAYVAAFGGDRTVLEDVSPAMLEEGAAYTREAFEERVARGKVTRERRDKALANFEVADSVQDACREADLLIEAVPEELEVKLKIFTILDQFSKPNAIRASNASSLSIAEMAAITFRAESCVGIHFFNPVPKMKLLEVVRRLGTSDTTVAKCVGVGLRMGKEVVVVREMPGFIRSHIKTMIGNEAFFMLREGLASAEDIDIALKLSLNHPMGPFELVDLVGLDVLLSIIEHLHKTLGEKCRPCPLLAQYMKAGRLG
jgi:3-hydroxybutyryl-CoA dehydrogenase